MKVKEENEKVGLKLNIQQTKIMASSSTTSWQIEEEKWKQRQIPAPLRAPKSLQTVIAAMKLKDTWKESYNNLDNRDITLPTKVHTVKAMVFPVVMYGCES